MGCKFITLGFHKRIYISSCTRRTNSSLRKKTQQAICLNRRTGGVAMEKLGLNTYHSPISVCQKANKPQAFHSKKPTGQKIQQSINESDRLFSLRYKKDFVCSNLKMRQLKKELSQKIKSRLQKPLNVRFDGV